MFGGDPVIALQEMPLEMKQLIRQEMIEPELLTGMLLSAHLIIFWLSQDSNVTPPVCLASFAAVGIAGTRPIATGLTSWKVAKGLYLVPVLFAYSPNFRHMARTDRSFHLVVFGTIRYGWISSMALRN